jgi:hypothetical protein
MLEVRRTVRYAKRRAVSVRVRPRRRVYVGSAVTRRASSRVFLVRTTQQVTARKLLSDCLGAAVTIAGVAGWAVLLMLLGG